MSVIALFTWIITALGGLFLLAIWLIEYDPDFQRATATRLPIPVISGHVLCAVSGLAAWILYLVTDKDSFAWATVVLLGAVAALGLTMAFRWLGVYRTSPSPKRAAAAAPPEPALTAAPRDPWTPVQPWPSAASVNAAATLRSADFSVPPERHFPLSVVIAHGVFAITTIVLVVLTVLGVAGGS
jgi:hypothetical protein